MSSLIYCACLYLVIIRLMQTNSDFLSFVLWPICNGGATSMMALKENHYLIFPLLLNVHMTLVAINCDEMSCSDLVGYYNYHCHTDISCNYFYHGRQTFLLITLDEIYHFISRSAQKNIKHFLWSLAVQCPMDISTCIPTCSPRKQLEWYLFLQYFG